jgi:putative ABC transport system substrate-binding protein
MGGDLSRVLIAMALLFGLVTTPLPAGAQARPGVPRIGMLFFGTPPSGTNPEPDEGLLQGLRELGYDEGQNILVERRYAGGRPDRLAAQAAELVRLKVDVILAGGPGPREAARHATRTIPIVTVSGADPVREGWARSLAHPGGNVTGLTVAYPELASKCLELLKQAFPGTVRVAVLLAPRDTPDATEVLAELEAAARRLGLQLQVIEIQGPGDFGAAFSRASKWQAQAVFALARTVVVIHRSQLAKLAVSHQMPSISALPLMAQAGFLMSYGADLDDTYRRSVSYVDKILKGARPGDLAIERPTRLQLSVNLKTAKALGLTIPQTLLLRADEVIQ